MGVEVCFLEAVGVFHVKRSSVLLLRWLEKGSQSVDTAL